MTYGNLPSKKKKKYELSQVNILGSSFKALLYHAIFLATCLAILLRRKLHESLRSLTCLKMNMSNFLGGRNRSGKFKSVLLRATVTATNWLIQILCHIKIARQVARKIAWYLVTAKLSFSFPQINQFSFIFPQPIKQDLDLPHPTQVLTLEPQVLHPREASILVLHRLPLEQITLHLHPVEEIPLLLVRVVVLWPLVSLLFPSILDSRNADG